MLRKIFREERGQALIITAIMAAVICGFAALCIDVGNLYLQHAELMNAVDAAALAGAQELPANTTVAQANALDYGQRNGVDSADLNVLISSDQRIIEVDGNRKVDFYFAKLLGLQDKILNAHAVARVGTIKSVNKRIVPFGVVNQHFVPGVEYTLKYGAGSEVNGNFGALALGGTGASNYLDNVKYGYNGALSATDWVTLETGDMSGPTRQAVEYRINACSHIPQCTADSFKPDCPRVAIVPIISSLEGNGRGETQIVGFAAFLLEGVTGNGNASYVTGRFVRTVTAGEIDDALYDYGLMGVKLVE